MRTTRILAATLVAAAALTACNSGDDKAPDPVPVRFTAAIDAVATPETRAAGTAWGAGDDIGVFMVQGSAALAVNKKYTTAAGDGVFAPDSSGDDIYYPQDGSPVSFIAYYPFTTGAVLDTPGDLTVSDQTKQPAFDLLWAKADNSGNGYTKTSGAVSLGFAHQLAKIVMNVSVDDNVGADLAALQAMSVVIEGMNTKAQFDLSDGSLAVDTGSAADITARTVTAGSKYDAIIMPGDYEADAVKVVFTVSGEPFTWTLSDEHNDFDAGNEYTYAVGVSRTGVTVTGSITAWDTEDNDRGSVDAN